MVAFVEHECDPVFVHGKCYRLEFLRENGLRFPDGLNINEDSCFNILALTLSPRTKHMAKPFYIWKWRDDSTVRQHDDFTQRFFLQIVDSNAILLDGLISRDREADASLAFGTFVIRTYPDMQEEWDAERYAVAMKRLTEHLVGYGYLWDMLTDENKAEILVTTESKASIDDIQKWADEIRGR
ncbi:MAG: hypothetical protein IJM90_01865, partial [Firmicutes bacterium]|nr:hypothetical protein [Bacillota bacterium]